MPEPTPQASPKESVRETTKRETRVALIHAGIEAFGEEGLDNPSLDAICSRAGFTRGAFYVHFKDRDDFIIAVVEHVLGQFVDVIIATGDAALDLERTVRMFVMAIDTGTFPFQASIPGHQFLAAASRSTKLRERYVSLVLDALQRVAHAVTEGQEAGSVRRDVDPEQVATLLVLIALGLHQAMEVGLPFDANKGSVALMQMIRPSD